MDRCPICGKEAVGGPAHHVFMAHVKVNEEADCFCGWRSSSIGFIYNLECHLDEAGGLDQHYTDFLMGVCGTPPT